MMRFSVLILFLSLVACRKKADPVVAPIVPVDTSQNTPGKLRLSFQNKAGDEPLVLHNDWYLTENGDSLKINIFEYYVSNIVLFSDTASYAVPESYYLVNEEKSDSKTFLLEGLPPGTYAKLQFLIGVDERRNTSGAQTGALDPANGMFWDWNNGYIMAKLEGESPQSAGGNVAYHIAGFRGENSVLQKVTLNFPQPIVIGKDATKNLHIIADALEWFKTPQTINIATYPVIASLGADAVMISSNYADMFRIDHID